MKTIVSTICWVPLGGRNGSAFQLCNQRRLQLVAKAQVPWLVFDLQTLRLFHSKSGKEVKASKTSSNAQISETGTPFPFSGTFETPTPKKDKQIQQESKKKKKHFSAEATPRGGACRMWPSHLRRKGPAPASCLRDEMPPPPRRSRPSLPQRKLLFSRVRISPL